MSEPLILTTPVGSYPTPEWLTALPSEQARLDATRVVFDIQRLDLELGTFATNVVRHR